MIHIKAPTAYFDVDDTLVLWNKEESTQAIEFDDKGIVRKLVPHKAHIQELKDLKAKEGYSIIVWSRRGGFWAKEVVKKLGLEEIVSLVIDKPTKLYDDLAPCEWMPRREYIKYIGDPDESS